MAEAITYADLRFVKAPLKKSISSRLGQDPIPDSHLECSSAPVPGGPSSLASSGLGDKAAVKAEQPTASWSAVTSLACAGQRRGHVLAPVPAADGAGPRGVQLFPG
uniref:CD72 molecule n=1 Tax=Rhinopithecus bieti TaxID=61621 RepID=A0A2K6MG89_RHIBE